MPKKNKKSAKYIAEVREKRERIQSARRLLHQENTGKGTHIAALLSALIGAGLFAGFSSYALFRVGRTPDGGIMISKELFLLAIGLFGSYLLFALLVYLVGKRYDIKKRMEKAEVEETDSSVIRLFREEIDLPYAVTDEHDRIIVASRALSDLLGPSDKGIGEEIHEICSETLDSIIRATTADHTLDRRIEEIYEYAVLAYPKVLRRMTDGKASVAFLEELLEKTSPASVSESGDRSRALEEVRSIATDALELIRLRKQLWDLCLSTFIDILSGKGAGIEESEKLDGVYDIAKKAYADAVQKEDDYYASLLSVLLKEELEEIIELLSRQSSMEQESGLCIRYYELLAEKQIPSHLYLALSECNEHLHTIPPSNVDATLSEKLISLTEAALERLLPLVDTGKTALPAEILSFVKNDILAEIVRSINEKNGKEKESYLPVLRTAELTLSALSKDQIHTFITKISDLISSFFENGDGSPTATAVSQKVKKMREELPTMRTALRQELLESFRHAAKKIDAKLLASSEETDSTKETVFEILQSETAGALSLYEIRTHYKNTLRELIAVARSILEAPDFSSHSERVRNRITDLVSHSVSECNHLLSLIQEAKASSASDVILLHKKILASLSALYRTFETNPEWIASDAGSEGAVRPLYERMREFLDLLSDAADSSYTSSELLLSEYTEAAHTVIQSGPLGKEFLGFSTAIEQTVDHSSEIPAFSGMTSFSADREDAIPLLLYHIGYYRAEMGDSAVSVLERAKSLLHKLLIRKVLVRHLYTLPSAELKGQTDRGMDGTALYELASSYYQRSALKQDALLSSAAYLLSIRSLTLFSKAGSASDPLRRTFPLDDPFVNEPLEEVRTLASVALAGLSDASPDRDYRKQVSANASTFRTIRDLLSRITDRDPVVSILHRISEYLADAFSSLRNTLFTHGLFETYTDTGNRILNVLYREQYATFAAEEIRALLLKALEEGIPDTLSFSGHSISDFASDTLLEIRDNANSDALSRMQNYAKTYASEALSAKHLFEYRERALLRMENHLLKLSEHDLLFTPRFLSLLLSITPPKNRKDEAAYRKNAAEKVALYRKKNPKDSSNKHPDYTRFYTLLSNVASLPTNSTDEDLAKHLAALLELMKTVRSNALDYRKYEKKLAAFGKLLKKEKATVPTPETGRPLSSVSIGEALLEFCDEAEALLKPAIPTSLPGKELTLLSDLLNNMRDMATDFVSPKFQIFSDATLVLLRNTVFSYKALGPQPINALLARIRTTSKAVGNENLPAKREEILLSVAALITDCEYFTALSDCYAVGKELTDRMAASPAEPLSTFSDALSAFSARLAHTVEIYRDKDRSSALSSYLENYTEAFFRDGKELSLFGYSFLELSKKKPENEEEKTLYALLSALPSSLSSLRDELGKYRRFTEKDSEGLRIRLRSILQNLKEVDHSMMTSGSRTEAVAALTAVSQYASVYESDPQPIRRLSLKASRTIASIYGYDENTEIFSDEASLAFAAILGYAESKPLCDRVFSLWKDLAERRTLYRLLVTRPILEMKERAENRKEPFGYPEAVEIFGTVTKDPAEFYKYYDAEFRHSVLLASLSAIARISAKGNVFRIMPHCENLKKEISELRKAIKSEPVSDQERFLSEHLSERLNAVSWIYDRFCRIAEDMENGTGIDREADDVAKEIKRVAEKKATRIAEIRQNPHLIEGFPAECEADITWITAQARPFSAIREALNHTNRLAEVAISHIRTTTPDPAHPLSQDLLSELLSYLNGDSLKSRADGETLTAIRRIADCTSELLRTARSPRSSSSAPLCQSVLSTLSWIAGENGEVGAGRMDATFRESGKPSGSNTVSAAADKKQAFLPVTPRSEISYHTHGLKVASIDLPSGKEVLIGSRHYIATSYPFRSAAKRFSLVTFRPIDEILDLKKQVEDDNLAVAFIVLDNLEELAQFVRADYRKAIGAVESVLRDWAGELGGVFRENERDEYVLFFSQKELYSLINDKFADILSRIERIGIGDSSMSVTVSMGISAIGENLAAKETSARSALDTALKRGGAQIVLYRNTATAESRYEFFHGKQKKGLQADNKVSIRVVADYLTELIKKASNVIIMGHSNPDFDSIGSCVGIARLAMFLEKEAYIVSDFRSSNFRDCTPGLRNDPPYNAIFIDKTTAMDYKEPGTLVVICDVSNTAIMEAPDLARSASNIVIIDHHIKVNNAEELDTKLTFIDPSASSASELVSEILEEALPSDTLGGNAGLLLKEEANVMLSGIMVDTKNFTRSVGPNTFSAALYLRRMGASTEASYSYFFEDSGAYRAEILFREQMKCYGKSNEIAITFFPTEQIETAMEEGYDLRVAASKAADKLLTVRGIHASFALYPAFGKNDSKITVFGFAISGRSDGTINVQLILEALNGGGHFDAAGAFVKESDPTAVIDALKASIDRYYQNHEENEKDE